MRQARKKLASAPPVQIGEQYGFWSVISESDPLCGDKAWLCCCECGTEKPVRDESLRNGTSQSCGCQSKRRRRTTLFPGQRFGYWTVLSRIEKPTKQRSWLCRCACGIVKGVSSNSLKRGKSLSCGCYRKEKWVASRLPKSIAARGYVLVYDEQWGNPRRGGRIFEHILVMTRHLDRALRRGECVHHKNGIRTDNRLDNLELWTTRHPKGARVNDLIKWAKDILEMYEPGSLSNSKMLQIARKGIIECNGRRTLARTGLSIQSVPG